MCAPKFWVYKSWLGILTEGLTRPSCCASLEGKGSGGRRDGWSGWWTTTACTASWPVPPRPWRGKLSLSTCPQLGLGHFRAYLSQNPSAGNCSLNFTKLIVYTYHQGGRKLTIWQQGGPHLQNEWHLWSQQLVCAADLGLGAAAVLPLLFCCQKTMLAVNDMWTLCWLLLQCPSFENLIAMPWASHEDLAYKIAQHEVRQLQMLVKKQKFICIKFQIHLYSSVAFYRTQVRS